MSQFINLWNDTINIKKNSVDIFPRNAFYCPSQHRIAYFLFKELNGGFRLAVFCDRGIREKIIKRLDEMRFS